MNRQMKNISDFFSAALPWICMGLFLAIVIVRGSRKKNDDKETMNYGTEGMALGMCFGTAIGTSLGSNTGLGMMLGMLAGFAIGLSIEKKNDNDEE